MQYDFDKEKLAVLETKGPQVYFVNKDNGVEEVEATHPKAQWAACNGHPTGRANGPARHANRSGR